MKRELSRKERWDFLAKYNYPLITSEGFTIPEGFVKSILRKLGVKLPRNKVVYEITTEEIEKKKYKAKLTLKDKSTIELEFETKSDVNDLKRQLKDNHYVNVAYNKLIARNQVIQVEFDEVMYKETESTGTYYMVTE